MFRRVLFPLDTEIGPGTRESLATLVPQVRQWQATLTLLTVLPSFAMPLVSEFFPADAEQRLVDEARRRLDELAEDILPGARNIAATVRSGTPYEEILACARESKADLIVMPGRSPSAERRRMLGSNTFKVVTQAPCAVLVLPQQVLARD